MAIINTVINQVLILALIILIGFYAKRRDILTRETVKKLSELLLRITNPFLVISAFRFEFSQDILHNVLIVFIFAICAHIFTIILGKFVFFKYEERISKILKSAIVYSNCGFMGYPILQSVYGKEAVLYTSVYVAAFNIFIWTHGVMLFTGEKNLKTFKRALINPGILCVAVGLIIFIFSIQLPFPVYRTLELVGSTTVPLSMLIIGATLGNVQFSKLLKGSALYFGTFIRLLVIPSLSLFILNFTSLPKIVIGTCVLLVAMPVAAMTNIFAEAYDGDSEFAARLVAFSTILSMLTLPLFIFFMNF